MLNLIAIWLVIWKSVIGFWENNHTNEIILIERWKKRNWNLWL